MRPPTLQAKLVLGTVGIIIGFVAVALVVLSLLVRQFAAEEIAHDLAEGRRAYEHYMTWRRRTLLDKAVATGRLPYLQAQLSFEPGLDAASAADAIRTLRAASGESLLVIGDRNGKFLADTLETKAFGRPMRGLTGVSEVLDGRVLDTVWVHGDQLRLVALAPVLSGNRVVGFLTLGDTLDERFAEEIRLITGRDVIVLHNGRAIAESWSRQPVAALAPDEVDSLTSASAEPGNRRVVFGGEERLALTIPLHGDGGRLVLSRAVSEIMALSERAWAWMLCAGMIIAGVGIALSLRTAHRLAKPLRELMRASNELADGNLEAEVDVDSEDEVGRLSRSFNAMARRIEVLVSDVRGAAVKADQANRAKDRFLTTVGHELRTPLTSVLAYAELLRTYGSGDLLEEQTEFVDIICSEAERLTETVDTVLDLVAIEAGKLEWQLSSFDLRDAVRETIDGLSGQLDFKEMRCELEVPDEALPCRADRACVQQVLEQLLINAWKFSPPGSTIRVDARADGADRLLTVKDCGPGIAGDAAKRAVFEKFHQQGDPLTEKPDGAGLGLALVKSIVEAHGGGVWCEDADGGGAAFVVRLPADSAELSSKYQPNPAPVDPSPEPGLASSPKFATIQS